MLLLYLFLSIILKLTKEDIKVSRQYLMYHLDGNVLSDYHSYLFGISKADQVLIGKAH